MSDRTEILERAAAILFESNLYLSRVDHRCKLLGPVPSGEYKPCQCLPCRIQYIKKELNPDPVVIDVESPPLRKIPTWLIKK